MGEVGVQIVFAGAFVFLGLALLASVVAIATGKLKRNSWLGLRTKALMASDEAWEKGHARAKMPLLRMSFGCFVCAWAMVSLLDPEVQSPNLVAALGLVLLFALCYGLFTVAKLAGRASK